MRLLFGKDAEVAHWVAERIPHVGFGLAFGPCAAIGVIDEEGFLRAGFVYHNHFPTYGSIEMSFAADTPRWCTKPIVCALLRYPFEQLQCQRVTGCTPRRAMSARRFLDRFGFKREGLVRRGFGTDDAVISGLLKTEWDPASWRPKRSEARKRAHGQIDPENAASS